MEEEEKPKPDSRAPDEIRMEEGAQELLESPEAQLYIRLAIALESGHDLKPALEEISRLPLEKRYLWRVVSALKWAFVDLDSASVVVDRRTLSRDDLRKVAEVVKHRPLQFCLFLRALFGSENMERIMVQAIEQAKAVPPISRG